MGLVWLFATLGQRAGGERVVEIAWSPGDTVGDVVHELLHRKPGLQGYILDQEGSLLPYVNVFVDGRDIRYLDGLDTTVADETELAIFPPVAGG